MHKSKIEKQMPEPQHSKEQKADGTSVRPAIAKPIVVCRAVNKIKMKKIIIFCLFALFIIGLPIFFWEVINPKLYCNDKVPIDYSIEYNSKAKMYAIKHKGSFIGRYTDGDWGNMSNPSPTIFSDSCEAKYYLSMAIIYYNKKKEISEMNWGK